ncbi:hypothetical protein [Paenibacillus typhae]|uniref:Uncharacterized protein n=1 Tax=Paenibacillus typhae TaxID=1174501 RepID=A0A1G8ZXN5_9BACL|nr:hypothetical protein [Paenibacillus typhae]SDK19858.1 hypothetical protein SAMN05216192_13444 [Paenibacillus typhae]
MKKVVRAFSLVMAFFLLHTIAIPAPAASADSTSPVALEKLTQLSGDDLLDTLLENGLQLPEGLEKDEYTRNAVKDVVTDIERGITTAEHIPYNYTKLAELAENILKISGEPGVSARSFAALASYSLQDSTVIGAWSDSYRYYNCYGYAIGNQVFKDPGYHSGKSFSISMGVSEIADLTVSDLDALGYWGYKTTTKPASLAYYQRVVAVRKGSNDYHFMKGDTSGSDWTHKPAGNSPMRWNFTSPGYKVWTNESSYQNVNYAATTSYTSAIYYVIYWAKNGPGPQPTKKIQPTV